MLVLTKGNSIFCEKVICFSYTGRQRDFSMLFFVYFFFNLEDAGMGFFSLWGWNLFCGHFEETYFYLLLKAKRQNLIKIL